MATTMTAPETSAPPADVGVDDPTLVPADGFEIEVGTLTPLASREGFGWFDLRVRLTRPGPAGKPLLAQDVILHAVRADLEAVREAVMADVPARAAATAAERTAAVEAAARALAAAESAAGLPASDTAPRVSAARVAAGEVIDAVQADLTSRLKARAGELLAAAEGRLAAAVADSDALRGMILAVVIRNAVADVAANVGPFVRFTDNTRSKLAQVVTAAVAPAAGN